MLDVSPTVDFNTLREPKPRFYPYKYHYDRQGSEPVLNN